MVPISYFNLHLYGKTEKLERRCVSWSVTELPRWVLIVQKYLLNAVTDQELCKKWLNLLFFSRHRLLIDWLIFIVSHFTQKSAMVNLFLCFLDMVPIVLQHFEFPVPTVIFPVHRKCKLGELQEICGIALDFISLAWSSVQISFLCIIARQLMCPRRLIQHLYTAQLV